MDALLSHSSLYFVFYQEIDAENEMTNQLKLR